jgi:4-hydroxybenzoate polyprenyltransferase/phosphoserine phosphatase
MNKKILAVDLDNTLIKTDMSFETLVFVIKNNPLLILKVLYIFILKGKSFAKKYLFENSNIDINDFKINPDIIDFIKKNKKKYIKVILISGSRHEIVRKFYDHTDIFDEYHGSDDNINLVGANKINFINSNYNKITFDYIGDSKKDIPIWKHCGHALIVSSDSLLSKLRDTNIPVEIISQNYEPTLNDFFYLLRVHHWIKNILLFIPMLLAHEITQLNIIILLLAFFSYSLIASSIYILNDLVDKKFDSIHTTKKHRPIASGKIQIINALSYTAITLAIGFLLALNVNFNFFLLTLSYFIIAVSYSIYLKDIIYLDLALLAIFFLSRILAGGFAVDISISIWFILFSMFFFLSMASIKRITEIQKYASNQISYTGRPYNKLSLRNLNIIGAISGAISMIVFVLYITSERSGIL